MSDFTKFGQAVTANYNSILQKDDGKKNSVFLVAITGDELWDFYLASFPEGTNPMFRERREYDCNTCRNFVRNLGAVVYADKGKLLTVWDGVEVEDAAHQAVADAMAKHVRSLPIKSRFVVEMPQYGCAKTTNKETGEVWNHFHGLVPKIFRWDNNQSDYIGETTIDKDLLSRSILEISDDAIEVVMDLIDQDSLYKGSEKRNKVVALRKLKADYAKLKTERGREIFLWKNSSPHTRILNDVVGTLLSDITSGKDLEEAVKAFEFKTAGPNYKRSKALVSQAMIDEAQKTVEKLGLEDSLSRRYAVREDISVNDVLFVDGSVKKQLLGGAFEGIKPTKKAAVPELKEVEEINYKDFLKKVLPKADSVEVFLTNEHMSNFVSLIAPVHADAKPLLKWDNAFSWSYDGEVTDSIRERVKKAGGKVDGDIRVSLSWHNADDLDLHMNNGRQEIYYHSRSHFGATLDVDMNGMDKRDDVAPVENIVWANKANAKPGRYEIVVHNYSKRSMANVGFEVEVEVLGKLYSYEHPTDLRGQGRVSVGFIVVANDGTITVEGLKYGGSSNEKWGVKSESWIPVDLITRSPNFWNDQTIGHEHIFFMLKGCANEEGTRGFYNEYLRDDLNKHRKVFEVVSSQMKVPYSADQLSGLGFSTAAKRAEILVRVKGATNRVLNVKF